MNRREKNELKARLGQYVDFGNGRFKDEEVERLASIVDKRDEYDGATRTYRSSYKSFDSEDTYRVEESDTYTFHSDKYPQTPVLYGLFAEFPFSVILWLFSFAWLTPR